MKKLKEIFEYRQMIYGLVRKDLRGRYKGSVLGFLWTFLNPLLQLVVYSVVFSYIMRLNVDKYYVFLFVALIPWIFFSTSVMTSSSSLIASKDLVTKIYFPRHVIPISSVTSCFVNMLYSFVIVFAVLLVSGIGINLVAVLFLPLVMLIEFILALGIAFIVSSVTVYIRDLEHILGIVMMAWMYFSPVMYSNDMIPQELEKVFNINPMSHILTAYRDILYYGTVPKLGSLIPAAVIGVLFMVVGYYVFSLLEKHFAEEL